MNQLCGTGLCSEMASLSSYSLPSCSLNVPSSFRSHRLSGRTVALAVHFGLPRRSLPFSFHPEKVSPGVASSNSISLVHCHTSGTEVDQSQVKRFAEIGNKLADASGEVLRKYFRTNFVILDKEDTSPVTIADQTAEESMASLILDNFPSHAIYGEEKGWRCNMENPEYVWVIDPIDGTKSFITGKPLFGTLIALLYQKKPVLGIINQPILHERWIGIKGCPTTLNGCEVQTRPCENLSNAYLYTTSPHMFNGEAAMAFARIRDKVKVPLYGCDCYAYALLASGFVDLVIECGLKPYDVLALVPVVEGAGGVITDWEGHPIQWEASARAGAARYNVVAAGDHKIHHSAIGALQWK